MVTKPIIPVPAVSKPVESKPETVAVVAEVVAPVVTSKSAPKAAQVSATAQASKPVSKPVVKRYVLDLTGPALQLAILSNERIYVSEVPV